MPIFDAVEDFEWDEGNARKNEKHGVSQQEAEQLFFHTPLVVSGDVEHSSSERKVEANRRDVPYQLLIKVWLREKTG